MDKTDIFAHCKRLGLKRKSAKSMGVHTKVIFTKNDDIVEIDCTRYSEKIWSAAILTKGGSIIYISSLDVLSRHFN